MDYILLWEMCEFVADISRNCIKGLDEQWVVFEKKVNGI